MARRPAQRGLVLVSAVLAVVAPVLQLTGASLPGRTVVAMLFILLVPGAPAVALLRLKPVSLYLALVLAVSLSSLLLLSTFLLAAHNWHPWIATLIMSAIGLTLTWPALRAAGPASGGPRLALSVDRERGLALAAVAVSAGLWVVSVSGADTSAMGAWGVAGAVGPAYWLALAVLAVITARQLSRPVLDPAVLTVLVIALAVEMFGWLNAADAQATFPTGWLHVGFSRYIAEHGDVAHFYDARFSWPAFFAGAAVLSDAAGLKDAVPLLKPAPVVDILLVMPAIWSIARTISGSARVAWLGVFTFLSLDWYQQDYFSPQATVYILYTGVIAALLYLAPPPTELIGKDAPWRHPLSRLGVAVPRSSDTSPELAVGREAMLLVVCAAIVVSHQLTPVNLLITLVVLVATGATRMRGLWLLVALAFMAYFTFGASEYWHSNIAGILNDIGNLGSTVNSSVGGHLRGDALHLQLQKVRVAWSAGSVLLALAAIWRLRRTTWVWLLAGLTLGPFGLLALQSYGGEVALRSFLYAEPFLAPLMAMTVVWALSFLPERFRIGALSVLLVVAFGMLTLTRGSNAAFEHETTADIQASRFAFTTPLTEPLPRTIGIVETAGFAGLENVTEWDLVYVDPNTCEATRDLRPCIRRIAPDLLLITKSMDDMGVLQDGLDPGWSTKLANQLVRAKLYIRVFARPGALVLKRLGPRP